MDLLNNWRVWFNIKQSAKSSHFGISIATYVATNCTFLPKYICEIISLLNCIDLRLRMEGIMEYNKMGWHMGSKIVAHIVSQIRLSVAPPI